MSDCSNNIRLNKTIDLICRQTDYTKEKALEKYLEWDKNYINVIKEYMNPDFEKKRKPVVKTLNQQIMTEIRNFCNNIRKN